MAKAFLLKYFPPSKTKKMRADITTFSQFEQESLYEAWERYKDLLQRCTHHELPLGLVVQTFNYGLISSNRTMIDAAACGNLLRKTAEEGYELLEEMAASSYHPQSERNSQRRNAGVHKVTDFSAVTAQIEALNRKIDNMNVGQPYGKQPMYRSDPPREEKSNLEQMMSKFILATETRLQNQDASIKGLENQIEQLAKMIASREPGTLPRNTETNPKEQVKSIALRNGKVLELEEKEKGDQGKEAVGTVRTQVFKKFHINIPFVDALVKMPSYAKFLKDILANKQKLEDHITVKLTDNCSALVQNQIPPKLKDPGTLCDLGASINLMPLSIFRKLVLGEPKPTQMSLQLANGSVKHPREVKEDVLVKVGKFTFPTDFVVLDMEEDREMPLILRRPFLATGKAVIEVQEEKLRLRDAMKNPLEATLTTKLKEDELDEEKSARVAYCNANHQWKKPERMKLEDMGDQRDLTTQKSSIEEPPTRELKPQPPHLKYVYLKRTKLAPDKRI
ncbi:uncharacterized protein [Primulina eburnea]|uniref:uncharacterized protein n=1 Tax=Primulina eburnea TaxID=1245227 RepID=UPI003C6C28E4